MEAENQVLRQQTLLQSPVKRMSEHLSIPTTPPKQVILNFLNALHQFVLLMLTYLLLQLIFAEAR